MAALHWQDAVFRTVPLPVAMPNAPAETFRQRLIELPYLMYGVDRLDDGRAVCLATHKPRSWQVWVHDAVNRQGWKYECWDLHGNIKLRPAHDQRVRLAEALYGVRAGKDRADLLRMLTPLDDDIDPGAHPAELLLAVQRWLGEPTLLTEPDFDHPEAWTSSPVREKPYTPICPFPGETALEWALDLWSIGALSRADVGTDRLPVLAYCVDRLSDGKEICITRPGEKLVYGQPSERHDFMVWTYDRAQSRCLFVTHPGTKRDIRLKLASNRELGVALIDAIRRVSKGEEPTAAMEYMPRLGPVVGESPELLLKNYKWIFGEEDCNYPSSIGSNQGRSMFMNELEALLI